MSAIADRTADVAASLTAAAHAFRGAVGLAASWTVDPTGAGPALPAPGSRAVQTTLGSVTLVLVTDPGLARHLQVGPPPAEDLLEGCAGPFDAMAAALAPLVAGAALGPLEEVDPAVALDAPGSDVASVVLLEDGTPRAAIVALLPAAPAGTDEPGPGPATPALDPLGPGARAGGVSRPSGLELLHDVEMGVTAELGRTRMVVREILDLVPGSVIELDRAAGSPVDVLVNGTLIARGEVVVVDEEFGVRITEVVGYDEGRLR